LGFIKQVQQAERIYLARSDRSCHRSMKAAASAVTVPGWPVVNCRWPPAPRRTRPSLKPGSVSATTPARRIWTRSRPGSSNAAYLPDALDLAAAIEQLRIEPDCSDCRQRLRAQLWRALQRPLPQTMRRSAADAMGQRYLDALEAQP
jgi:hypothetical protein